jgi:hypothetical protein
MTATQPQSRPTVSRDTRAGGAPVYIDPEVVLSQHGNGRIDEASLASDARLALETLAETGHDLVLVTDLPVSLPVDFPQLASSPELATSGAGWFLTTDPERCGPRRADFHSILVGPGPTGRRSEIHRCDIRTRDLHSAVIEILSREAMAPVA